MATLAFGSAGATIAISAGVPATIDSTGFGALSYTAIPDVTDLGMVGPEASIILHSPLAENVTYKVKGPTNNGAMDMKGAKPTSVNAGHTLLQAAVVSPNSYAIKITMVNGALIYFQTKVTSYKTNIGNNGQLVGFESKLEVDGSVVFA
jgi:hypothetical protein